MDFSVKIKKLKGIDTINRILLILTLAILLLVLVPITFNAKYLFLAICSFLWIIFTYLSNNKFYKWDNLKSIFPFIIFIIYHVIYVLLGNGTIVKSYLVIILIMLMVIYYMDKTKEVELSVILNFIMLYYIIVAIVTNIELVYNPSICRILAQSSVDVQQKYSGAFIANYPIIYSMSFLSMMLFNLCFEKKQYNKYIPVLLLFVITIIRSKYVISLFLLVLYIIVQFFLYFKSKFKLKTVVYTCLFLILLLLLFDDLLYFLSNYVNPVYAARFGSIADFMNGKIINGSPVYMRILVYSSAIPTIFNNFLFGIGNNVENYIVGQTLSDHSTIIDLIAQFGIIGFILMGFGLYYIFKYILFRTKYEYHKIVIVMSIMFIVFAAIDLAHFSQIVTVIFFLVPLFLYNCSNSKE